VTSGADEQGSPEVPETGEPQETPVPPGQSPAAPQPGSLGDAAGESLSLEEELAQARKELGERTADLQRLQAEYLNYKRRVDRDRELVRQNATYAVLGPIIDVLDTVDRAREHGELEGGFKAVAEQLDRAVTSMGLTRFGAPGDAFDPELHDALSHLGTSPDVTVVTCRHIVKSGYRFGDRVVRAAQVVVVDPEEATTEPAAEDTDVPAE
jgi:molecular chaperone GrpE